MDSGVVRAVLLLALVLLFAGDFVAVVSSVAQFLAGARGDPPEPHDAVQQPRIQTASGSSGVRSQQLMTTMKVSCLPKLICELNASPHKERLSDAERSLLALIRDTTISTTAEVSSRYHFAAHMGQLIAGIDGAGCHNFYPGCPFAGSQVLAMLGKLRFR